MNTNGYRSQIAKEGNTWVNAEFVLFLLDYIDRLEAEKAQYEKSSESEKVER